MEDAVFGEDDEDEEDVYEYEEPEPRRGRREADRDDDDDADNLSKPMPIRQWLLPVMCVSFPHVLPCLKHRRYRLSKRIPS